MELYEILWREALPKLESSISTINYSNFISKIEPIDIRDTKLILMVKNEVQYNMIKTKILSIIKEVVCSLNNGVTDVDIFVGNSKEEYESQLENQYSKIYDDFPIDPKYTFENFVVGSSNKFAYAASQTVAKNPGGKSSDVSCNPLFISGASGLGKTHLLHAIANEVRLTKPSLNVLYSPSEKFLNDFIEALHSSKGNKSKIQEVSDFREKYGNVDILIIDDIQNLSGKEGTQDVFFNIFNELYGENKQIVLSADCDVKEIQHLSDRLKTRFEWGLKVQITPPDIETKIAILQKKAAFKKYILTMDVASYIAEQSDDNVRSLEGLLNKVIFASKLLESPITIDLAKETLKEQSIKEAPKNTISNNVNESKPLKKEVTTDSIIEIVSAYYKINKDDIVSKKRTKEVVEPRHICIYLMSELLSIPQESIGKAVGRDHATVIHSRDKVISLIQLNAQVATEVNDLKNLILGK